MIENWSVVYVRLFGQPCCRLLYKTGITFVETANAEFERRLAIVHVKFQITWKWVHVMIWGNKPRRKISSPHSIFQKTASFPDSASLVQQWWSFRVFYPQLVREKNHLNSFLRGVTVYIGEDILTASSFSEGILSQFCALVQEMPKRRCCNIWADAALQLMGLNLLDCTLHIQASNAIVQVDGREALIGGSYSALQAPVTGRHLKAFGIGPAQLATHYSFYFCRFGICLNLTICSNSKMFQFETIQIRNCSLSKMFRFETCSNPKICLNPKTVQNSKSVPFKICSILNMFKFENMFHWNLFHLKYVQIWKSVPLKSVPFEICSNFKICS
jgi:hypothetical protein